MDREVWDDILVRLGLLSLFALSLALPASMRFSGHLFVLAIPLLCIA